MTGYAACLPAELQVGQEILRLPKGLAQKTALHGRGKKIKEAALLGWGEELAPPWSGMRIPEAGIPLLGTRYKLSHAR